MEYLKPAVITPILTGWGLFSSLGKAPFVVKWMLQFMHQLFLHTEFPARLCSGTALKVVKAIKAVLFKIYTDIP